MDSCAFGRDGQGGLPLYCRRVGVACAPTLLWSTVDLPSPLKRMPAPRGACQPGAGRQATVSAPAQK
eukprot:3645472-Pyramimonas_sp.AAC.1